jgi:prophage regulatory protein
MVEPVLRFVSLKETAARIGVNRATLYRWQELGKFPRAVRLSESRIAFREADVNEWMRSRVEVGVS